VDDLSRFSLKFKQEYRSYFMKNNYHFFQSVILRVLLLSAFLPYVFCEQTQSTGRDVQPRLAPKISPVLELQILLDRAGFSPGEIDGNSGMNTKRVVSVYLESHSLASQSAVQTALQALKQTDSADPLEEYKIISEDVQGLFNSEIPKDYMAKAELPALGYTSPLELLGEKFHSSPLLLQKLNPKAEFQEGENILVPNVTNSTSAKEETPHQNKKEFIVVVSSSSSNLIVKDGQQIIFYAPVTAGSEHDPLPTGNWKVKGISKDPTFYYNPELFWDADPSHSKTKLPPGPNNPVGVVWIEISAPHYGLHGTPEPSKIGHSESHGCVRLTNWDAEELSRMVEYGTGVIFE
jgi:lipoprotein-anchoring transpeptidase ErfK/SrfK